jgi:hypothetical protein
MTLRSRLVTVGILAGLVMAWATPAQATVIEREHYSFSVSFETEVCGLTLRQDISGSGVFHARVGKNRLESAFFGIDNYESTSTLTNEDNGNFVVIEANGVFHDTRGTLVSGTIFKFTTIDAGQAFIIRDMTGQLVSRNRGVFQETYLFDTLGDETPGGLYLEQLGLMVAGPHPILDEESFCAIVRPLLVA